MTASVFTQKYSDFRDLLIKYRRDAGITQQALADRLSKPQSFVSKFENGERRLDLIEFIEVSEALKFDVHEFIERLIRGASA